MGKSWYLTMKENLLFTLYKLAEMGAYPGEIELTTSEIGKRLEFSQQTASRHLIELEDKYLIRRSRRGRKEAIKITDEGMDMLRDMYVNLQRILEETKQKVTISGILFSGLGEGAYYISHDGYKKEFIKKLGFEPFPGTLNLRILNVDDLKKIAQIRQSEPYIIRGFQKKGRQFGDVMCYKARFIYGTMGAIIIPSRTHHNKDILEAIAPVNLREKLAENPNLPMRDGVNIRIDVLLQ